MKNGDKRITYADRPKIEAMERTGDKVTGYKVEYSAMVAVEAKPLFREA